MLIGCVISASAKKLVDDLAVSSKVHTKLVANLNSAVPLTVFASNNETLTNFPKGTVENLLKLDNKSTLDKILKYHFIPSNVDSAAFLQAQGIDGILKGFFNILFKDDTKANEKGLINVTIKEGKVIRLKKSYAKDLISKDINVLSSGEKEVFVALYDKLVYDLGVEVVAKAFFESLLKIPDTLERKATERYLLDNYFNKTRSELGAKLIELRHQKYKQDKRN
jgi:hypothetical protein